MYVAAFLSESSPDVSIRKHFCRLLSASSDRACARQTRPRPHAHSRDPSARHAFLIDNSMLVCYTASQVMSWHDSKVHPPCLKAESRGVQWISGRVRQLHNRRRAQRVTSSTSTKWQLTICIAREASHRKSTRCT